MIKSLSFIYQVSYWLPWFPIPQAQSKPLENLKDITTLIQNVILTVSIIIGGIWGYYKFIKGRLLAPKIDIDLKHQIIKTNSYLSIAAISIIVKNIGSVRLIPEIYRLDVHGFSIDGNVLISEEIHSVDNLLPKSNKTQYSYIEPNETDIEPAIFKVSTKYQALLVEITLQYKQFKIRRSFFVSCDAQPQSIIS